MKTALRWLLWTLASFALAGVTWVGFEARGAAQRDARERDETVLDAMGAAVSEAKSTAVPWVADLTQFRDGARREAAFAAVRAALASDDRVDRLAALVTIRDASAVFDEYGGGLAPLRPQLRELAASSDFATCWWALLALAAGGPSAPDAALAVERTRAFDVFLATRLADPLVTLADHEVFDDVARAMLRLLDAEYPDARKEAYSALWGARVDDRVAARLVDLAGSWTYGEGDDVVYHAASRVMNKNDDLVDLLVDRIGDQSIALDGLSFGVADDQRERVCDVWVDVLAARDPSDRDWGRALDVLARDGSARHAGPLRALLDTGTLTDDDASRVRSALDQIARRGS